MLQSYPAPHQISETDEINTNLPSTEIFENNTYSPIFQIKSRNQVLPVPISEESSPIQEISKDNFTLSQTTENLVNADTRRGFLTSAADINEANNSPKNIVSSDIKGNQEVNNEEIKERARNRWKNATNKILLGKRVASKFTKVKNEAQLMGDL